MDFKLSREQEERREEFFEVCKELDKEKPQDFIEGIEAAEAKIHG